MREIRSEDRRVDGYMMQEHRDGFFSIRSRDILAGLLSPVSASLYNGRKAYELLTTHSIFLIGTPRQIAKALGVTPSAGGAPALSIVSPAEGTVLESGSFDVEAALSSGADASISLAADGVVLKTCPAAASCAASVKSAALSPGTHRITATATDDSGEPGRASATITKAR